MINPTLKISMGNKAIGIISFIAVFLVSLCLVIPRFSSWETFLVAGLLILIYSFQASKISYISLNKGHFFIVSIFRSVILKDAFLFDEVIEIIPFTNLMKIKFRDGSSYIFWGKSGDELNRLIKDFIAG